MEFKWIDWNRDHATRHGVSKDEIEFVVNGAMPPYPEQIGDGKSLVVGQDSAGRYVQAIYVTEPDGILFVIHARPLTDVEKRRFRRRRR
jgi:uncharacterized DUF497 family protein